MNQNETTKERGSRKARIAVALVGLMILGFAVVPTASALAPATGSDRCNGVYELDGCTYVDGGIDQHCKKWVAGVCVEGG